MPDPLFDSQEDVSDRPGILVWWGKLSGNVRGSLLFFVSAVLFSVMVAMIKLAGERLHVTEVLFFRQLTMTVIALPVIISGWPQSVRSARPGLQIFRVFAAFGAMTLGFGAVIHLPLAEVTVITFSKAFFTTILAIVILGEVVAMPRWIALCLGFLGVLVIVWPDGNTDSAGIWHVAAVISALCVAMVIVTIRILTRVDRPVTILTYQAVGVGLLTLPPMLWFWKTPTTDEWLLVVAIGVISAAAQYINILSIRAAEASALAPLEYTRLVFAAAVGYWLFDEVPGLRIWIGAAVIIGAALYVLHREQRKAGRAAQQSRSISGDEV